MDQVCLSPEAFYILYEMLADGVTMLVRGAGVTVEIGDVARLWEWNEELGKLCAVKDGEA